MMLKDEDLVQPGDHIHFKGQKFALVVGNDGIFVGKQVKELLDYAKQLFTNVCVERKNENRKA